CHLRSAELRRGQDPILKQGSHPGTAQYHMVVGPVGASLRRRHLAALPAEEAAFETEDGDPQLFGKEAVEDLMAGVAVVVVSHTGVVPADDEVGAAVVLPAEGMEDGLARPGVAHGGREGSEKNPVPRVIPLEEHLVAPEADFGRQV